MKLKILSSLLLALTVALFAAGCGEDGNTSGSAESRGMISDAEASGMGTSHPITDAVSDVISGAGDVVSDLVSGAESFFTPDGNHSENPAGISADTTIEPVK